MSMCDSEFEDFPTCNKLMMELGWYHEPKNKW